MMQVGVGTVSQKIRLPFEMMRSPQECQFGYLLLCLPSTGLPMYLKRQWKIAQNTWTIVTHVGDPDGIPGSWLWPGSVLSIAAIWRMKQTIDESFLLLSLPVFFFLSFKWINKTRITQVSIIRICDTETMFCISYY